MTRLIKSMTNKTTQEMHQEEIAILRKNLPSIHMYAKMILDSVQAIEEVLDLQEESKASENGYVAYAMDKALDATLNCIIEPLAKLEITLDMIGIKEIERKVVYLTGEGD